jgi:LacI family transcriptional regulator
MQYKKTTIMDVAKISGLSISSVSRVLNNPNYPVSNATRERILKTVEKTGYRSRPGSHYSRKQISREVGVIVPNISNPFYSQAFFGIEKEFQIINYSVVLYNSFRNPEHEYKLLKSLYQKGIRGVILSSVSQEAAQLQELIDRGMQLIFLDQKIDELGCHISFEYREGAYNAVQYLFQLGHRDICLAMTPLTRWTRREILAGYSQAMNDLGLGFRGDMLLTRNEEEHDSEDSGNLAYEHISGRMKALEFVEKHPGATAVLCVNDLVAFGFIQELRTKKINVPEDVSVIGFDDIPFSSMYSPALTTVRCPTFDIGRLAAQLLQQQLNGSGFNMSMKLASRLIIRSSTAGLS